MKPDELAARILAGTPPEIIDVRSRWEFERGHVPGARRCSFWKITSFADEIAAQKDDEIVLYCGHGPRAQWAAAALRRRGFGGIVLLDGHWARWAQEGQAWE